ncbi:MAG TPA: DUF2567 domain-containing protein [Natronosporangium sp.]
MNQSPPTGSPPPAAPVLVPVFTPPPRPEPVRPGRVALTGLAIAIGMALLGVPFGLVWAAVAPDTPVIMTEIGPVYGASQPEQPIAADGWFALLALPVGVVGGFVAWLLGRPARGLAALTALIVGGIGTGLVGWWVGRRIGLADYRDSLATAEVGAQLARPADLAVVALDWWPPQLFGVLLVPALAAAATYTLIAAWSPFPSLHPEPPGYYGPAEG